MVSTERESISVPMSLFWPSTCSEDLGQTCKYFCINFKENKHSTYNFSWQYSNNWEEYRENLNESRHCSISAPVHRFSNNNTEIQLEPSKKMEFLDVEINTVEWLCTCKRQNNNYKHVHFKDNSSNRPATPTPMYHTKSSDACHESRTLCCTALTVLQQKWTHMFPYTLPPFSAIGKV